MDITKHLEDPKSWWSYQLFKSKLSGRPIYREILMLDNRIRKVIFFNGFVMNHNDVGAVLHSFVVYAGLRGKKNIRYSVFDWSTDIHHLSQRQALALETLIEMKVVEPEYETHPYHKLKNPAIIKYIGGPHFETFTKFLSQISIGETELILESDIMPDDQGSGTDSSGE